MRYWNFLRVRRAGHSTVVFDGPQSGSFAYDAVPDDVGDEPFVLGVRPQYFEVSQSPTDGAFEATVTVTEPIGDEQLLTVTVGEGEGHELSVRVPIHVDVTRGESVWLAVDAARTYAFDPETGARLAQQRRARPATPD